MYNNKPAKLILDNGKVFSGYALGKIGITLGEVCFNTGMTGYQEILTDPSYAGQIITMTNPHIGNYGVNKEDEESKRIHASGFIVKECSSIVSNYRATQSLEKYLIENNIVGIQGIDTRSVTKILRNEGTMNGIISSKILNNKQLVNQLNQHPNMFGMDLAKQVTCKKTFNWSTNNQYKIAAIDYGIKRNILNLLEKSDCSVRVFPATITSSEIIDFKPDGIFLSNGPGDPAAAKYAIKTVQELIKTNIPIFGICLGHQILALSLGAKTYKLKFGHRGCNHPVINHSTKKIEITSQNHGFSVDVKSLPKNILITHSSLNDNTLEGMKCTNLPIFSVQYHPESSPGPHDSRYLFKQFIDLIKIYIKEKNYAKTE